MQLMIIYHEACCAAKGLQLIASNASDLIAQFLIPAKKYSNFHAKINSEKSMQLMTQVMQINTPYLFAWNLIPSKKCSNFHAKIKSEKSMQLMTPT